VYGSPYSEYLVLAEHACNLFFRMLHIEKQGKIPMPAARVSALFCIILLENRGKCNVGSFQRTIRGHPTCKPVRGGVCGLAVAIHQADVEGCAAPDREMIRSCKIKAPFLRELIRCFGFDRAGFEKGRRKSRGSADAVAGLNLRPNGVSGQPGSDRSPRQSRFVND
jgi:hypothetical protein